MATFKFSYDELRVVSLEYIFPTPNGHRLKPFIRDNHCAPDANMVACAKVVYIPLILYELKKEFCTRAQPSAGPGNS